MPGERHGLGERHVLATDWGSSASATTVSRIRREIAPSLIPEAWSQAVSAVAATPKMGFSTCWVAPVGSVFEYSSRYK
jgi:hypothetical protein